MAELSRQNSVERLLEGLHTDSNAGAITEHELVQVCLIQHWWRHYLKLNAVLNAMKDENSSINIMYQTISTALNKPNLIDNSTDTATEKPLNFNDVQKMLNDSAYTAAVTQYMNKLPPDPTLKHRNVMAKSVRILSSAILMHTCPDEVLLTAVEEQEDDSREQNGGNAPIAIEEGGKTKGMVRDSSAEARACKNAATMVSLGLHRLLQAVITMATATSTSSPWHQWKSSLLYYRFAMRYYIQALAVYQHYCDMQMVKYLENAYMQNYALYTALSVTHKKYEEDAVDARTSDTGDGHGDGHGYQMLRQAKLQCDKIKKTLLNMCASKSNTHGVTSSSSHNSPRYQYSQT